MGDQPGRPQVLVKQSQIQFLDFDLGEILKDSTVGLECKVEFVLRYSDPYGKQFKRKAAMTIDRVRLELNRLPKIVNYQIEPDRDASVAL